MIRFAVTVAVFAIGIAIPITDEVVPDEAGWWSQYAQQPTDIMIEYRGWTREDAQAFIAVPDCTKVGRRAEIWINGNGPEDALVFDCTSINLSWWVDNRIIGELDYYTAVRHGVAGQGGVRAELIWE